MSDSNNRGNSEQNPSEEKSDDVDSKNNNRRSIPPVNEDFLKLMSMFSAGLRSAAEDELECEEEE